METVHSLLGGKVTSIYCYVDEWSLRENWGGKCGCGTGGFTSVAKQELCGWI